MNIELEKARNADAQIIFDAQIKAFMPLLEKYKDYHTNPANETIERVKSRTGDEAPRAVTFYPGYCYIKTK